MSTHVHNTNANAGTTIIRSHQTGKELKLHQGVNKVSDEDMAIFGEKIAAISSLKIVQPLNDTVPLSLEKDVVVVVDTAKAEAELAASKKAKEAEEAASKKQAEEDAEFKKLEAEEAKKAAESKAKLKADEKKAEDSKKAKE